MESVRTSHQSSSARLARSRVPRLVAIAALLSCSLALAGPPMKAGAFSEGSAATERRASAKRSAAETSAVALTGRLQTPLTALPAHSAELAGLFVLGLSLLGAGRYLRRGPVNRSRLHSVEQAKATEGTVPGSLVRRWTARSSVR